MIFLHTCSRCGNKLTRLVVAPCKWVAYIIGFACADRTMIMNATIRVDAACSEAWIYAFLSFAAFVKGTF